MSLTVFAGPMFAGKTTALVAATSEAVHEGRVIHVVKHTADERYTTEPKIITHDGVAMVAHSVARGLGDVDLGNAEVVAVDEGHFYHDLADVCDRWAREGRQVLVSTLISDYNREPFGEAARLLAKADHVSFTQARCTNCGEAASFTFFDGRRSLKQEKFVVGGAEKFRPLCRRCFSAAENSTRGEQN